MPPQSTLNTFLPLIPTLLNSPSSGGEPKPKCNDLCLPIPGSRLLEMYGMDPQASKWGKLGVVAAFLVGHFTLLCFATSLAKRFEKR